MPIGASAGNSIMVPGASSPIPNSRDEQIMPCESIPRNFAFLILKSPGSTPPTFTNATFKLGRTLTPPQTTSVSAPSPVLTRQKLKRSASGCGSHVTTSATTTSLNWPATGSQRSTSKPSMVNASVNCIVPTAGFTHCRNHFSLNCIKVSLKTVAKIVCRFQTINANREYGNGASPSDLNQYQMHNHRIHRDRPQHF